MSSKCCNATNDNSRRALARIRCFKECVESLKSFSRPLPQALCFVPAEIEYRVTKTTRLVYYSGPSKECKKLSEISLPKESRIIVCNELCNSDGQWGKLIKVTSKGKTLESTEVEGEAKWILIFSTQHSGSDAIEPVLSQKDEVEVTNAEIFKGKQTKTISSWEKVVEHEFVLKLGQNTCVVASPDDQMINLLRSVPANWTIHHDEVLAQFLCQHIEKENINLGCIKDYVESIDVSSMSDDDGPQNLTDDNPDTYWETDGSQGQHWIRLKMKKGTVIKKLLLSIDSTDDNYVPSRILVMGGEPDNLKKLNDVSIDHSIYGPNDVLVLSDQSEHWPVIELRIKECKDDGIDTRIHGIKIKSSKERDLGISCDLFVKKNLVRYPLLDGFDQDVLYRRAIVLHRLLQLVDSILPFLVPRWDYSVGYYASLETLRQLLPLSKKRMLLVDQFIRESETTCPSMPKLYINRRAAMEHKLNPAADPLYKNSVFSQMYDGLKPRDPSQKPLDYRWPMRYEQWWECKFLSEGIIDQGGGFRDSLSDLAEELCPTNTEDPVPLPFFVRTPNHGNVDASNNRDMYVPNPQCTEFHKYEWIGKIMGACLRGKESLVLSLPPFIWKMLSGQEVTWSKDFVAIDEMEVKLMESMVSMDKESFDAYFGEERNWTCRLSNGTQVPLKPGGADISLAYSDCLEYARLVQETRMNESKEQVQAIQRGILQVVPQAVLEMLTWHEFEKRVCGDPEISMEALRNYICLEELEQDENKVKYLWEALENFSNEDRSRFVRFVTGRRRLPAQIHVYPGDQTDVLPSSSTCANSLFLPSYSSAKMAEDKIRYAIYNCIAIDTDTNAWEE